MHPIVPSGKSQHLMSLASQHTDSFVADSPPRLTSQPAVPARRLANSWILSSSPSKIDLIWASAVY